MIALQAYACVSAYVWLVLLTGCGRHQSAMLRSQPLHTLFVLTVCALAWPATITMCIDNDCRG